MQRPVITSLLDMKRSTENHQYLTSTIPSIRYETKTIEKATWNTTSYKPDGNDLDSTPTIPIMQRPVTTCLEHETFHREPSIPSIYYTRYTLRNQKPSNKSPGIPLHTSQMTKISTPAITTLQRPVTTCLLGMKTSTEKPTTLSR
jgi:hypothetical protein